MPKNKGQEIRPQPKQMMALSSAADVLIYGGGAGGGKTWTLLLEPLRHIQNPKFTTVTFRRTSPQITNPGGLWDKSGEIYPLLGAKPNQTDKEWHFPSGAKAKFAHLQHDSNIYDWQGSEVVLFNFDELTHFTEKQFWYMFSRARSTSGIRPYFRATTNPDADSWVANLLSWWVDQETGFTIPERWGVLRWFVRINGELEWADSKEELQSKYPKLKPKSFTFIESSLYDNPALIEKDPDYEGNLQAQTLVERQRLLDCNWKVKVEAGKFFNRAWFDVKERVQLPNIDVVCSFWDLASTEKQLKGNDPDYSARVMVGYSRKEKKYVILDAFQTQSSPADVERLFHQMAKTDRALASSFGAQFLLRWEVEPGSAGKREAFRLTTELAGFDAKGVRDNREKFARAKPLARQAEAGNVLVMDGPWNNTLLSHLHNQPDEPHDDLMDGASGAFNNLTSDIGGAGGFW